MRFPLVLAFAMALCPVSLGSAQAQSKPFSHAEERQRANENLLMLLGGPLGGPYIQLAQDIALATKDADVRVLPIAGDGAVKNVRDVLFVRGVDMGITSVQTLNALKASGELGPGLDRRIAYIAPLSVDMFHVLARPELNTAKDLQGKRVSFNLKGSASATFGPAVLKALGIEVQQVHATPNEAVQMMRNGKLDAAVCLCPMPVPAYPPIRPEAGFKFLEIPYMEALEASYLPASLTSAVYPNLIAEGAQVKTIATSTILVSFNWTPGTDRYRKLEKFVDAFFSNFDKLRRPGRHPAWRSVNPAATVRGWRRLPAAQRWLDRQAREATSKKASDVDAAQARAQAAKVAPHDRAEQERLFREFLEWSKHRPQR